LNMKRFHHLIAGGKEVWTRKTITERKKSEEG